MKSRKIEVWVGLFVLLSIAALLMLALKVSGLSDFDTVKRGFEVKASFTNIGGLKGRAKVTICGVTIGRVTSIKLERNEYGEYQAQILMSLNTDMQEIPTDSSAKILTSGLLGDNYIEI